jgi:hypothetical protein
MNQQEAIQRLCSLVSHVGRTVYKNEHPFDCFCVGILSPARPEISEPVIAFIEEAVYAQQRESKH